jgi:argininosuccinate lyase
MAKRKTIVGKIDAGVLAFTAGKDAALDRVLVEADCIGSAAHVTMLARLKRPALFTITERDRVIRALVAIIRKARQGTFRITVTDQDVHMAVERTLTASLGDLGKRIHTARSRNDQVATDLRLYGRDELLDAMDDVLLLANALLRFAGRHQAVPMVGRTHMQPAMPSSVGLWAAAHAEGLLDDMELLKAAYAFNNRSPLGSAAGYGVPLKIDRALTARLLGFERPVHTSLAAASARGKCEGVVLSALSQVMVSLSRLAEDLILYTAPEFGYFTLPEGFCTGSSIMPQKKNPDVLELVRARASSVAGAMATVQGIVKGLPSGYYRDLQETKEPFLEGMATARSCVCVMAALIKKLKANRTALRNAFTPEVFATDEALRQVCAGVSFRDAYRNVRKGLEGVAAGDPDAAVAERTHEGAPGNVDVKGLQARATTEARWVSGERKRTHAAISKLLGVAYPRLRTRR